jgi:molybdopterin biosynthesis enzyme MoaB
MQALIIVKLEGIIELFRVQFLQLKFVTWDQLCSRQVRGIHRFPFLVLQLLLLGGAE